MTGWASKLKRSMIAATVLGASSLAAQEGFDVGWDASPSAEQDRFLHAAIAYHTSQVAGSLTDRPWLGAVVGLAVQLPKETFDGLSDTRDFSLPDLLAAGAGSLLPALRQPWPALEAVQLKVWYFPSREWRDRQGVEPRLWSDYAGQRYFLTVGPGRLTSGGIPWPRWLNVGVGHSTTPWTTSRARSRWFVGLDVALRELAPRHGILRTILLGLDQIHAPGPGIEISDGRVRFGLY